MMVAQLYGKVSDLEIRQPLAQLDDVNDRPIRKYFHNLYLPEFVH